MSKIVSGYFIVLDSVKTPIYFGIDRDPFAPILTQQAIDNPSKDFVSIDKGVWTLYSGWKQQAYKVVEENSTSVGNLDWILNDIEVAKEALDLISKNSEHKKLIFCQIFELRCEIPVFESSEHTFFGYDAAYLGGDYYSAVRSFLESPELQKLMSGHLQNINQYGLLRSAEFVDSFVADFCENVSSERFDDFVGFQVNGVFIQSLGKPA